MRCLTVISAVLCCSIAFSQEDTIKQALDAAKQKYKTGIAAVEAALLTSVDAKIKEVAQGGNLEVVQDLMSQKKLFLETKSPPSSEHFKAVVSEYSRERIRLHLEVQEAYDVAVTEYTKILQLEKAAAVKAESRSGAAKPVAVSSKGVDLLKQLDPKSLPSGWSLTKGELRCNQPSNRTVGVDLPGTQLGSFELSASFTPISGNNAGAHFGLPVGKDHFVYLMLALRDRRLLKVEGYPGGDINIESGIEPGKTYKVLAKIAVDSKSESAKITILLDGKSVIDWSGPISKLRKTGKEETAGRLKVTTYESAVAFKSLEVTSSDQPPPPEPKDQAAPK